jgi:protein-tyrosine phosphatase
MRLRSIGAAGLLAAVVAACGSEPSAELARHVALEGQPNFRDLGGYETADGRTVKWGQIYRSGELPELTDADVVRLEELGLRSVVNLLLPEEIEKNGPDRLPEGVRELRHPIQAERTAQLSIEAGRAIREGDFSKLPPEVSVEIHRLLLDEARPQYAALLRALLDPENRPLVFHCSHGVHRTGTAAAVLLSTLGVPWETVRKDYLLSNEYRKEEVERQLARIRAMAAVKQGIAPEDVDMTNVTAFYVLSGDYIDGTLEQVRKDYGSMEAYVRKGLGLTEAEIERLQEELLED